MSFIYEQIGLEDHAFQEVMEDLIDRVLNQLQAYTDNGPILLDLPYDQYFVFDQVLDLLQKHKILIYYVTRDEEPLSYDPDKFTVAVINRYKFEMLNAELIWLARPEEEKGPEDNTAPYVDDLVFYDTETGDMLFNGEFKTLKGRNKKLFDALYLAAPQPVDRKKLLRIARAGKYTDEPEGSVVSEAITNLRKVCGVKAHAIPSTPGGGRVLTADVYPLTLQFPRHSIGFEEYRYISRKDFFSPLL